MDVGASKRQVNKVGESLTRETRRGSFVEGSTCRDDATKVSDNLRDQDESVAHRRAIVPRHGKESNVNIRGIRVCDSVIESWAKICKVPMKISIRRLRSNNLQIGFIWL